MKLALSKMHIHPSTVGFSVLGAGLVLVLVFFLILPAGGRIASLRNQNQQLKFEVKEQETLLPIYEQFKNILGIKVPDNLPAPEPSKLVQQRIPDISSIFTEKARECNLEPVAAAPEVKSLVGGFELLSVNAVVRGELPNIRRYLVALGSMPYLAHFESMAVQVGPAGKELRMKIWLAIEQ